MALCRICSKPIPCHCHLNPSATPQPTDRAALRDQLLDALDFAYCQGLGYATPEELLAAYDATRQPTGQADHRQENDHESA